MTAVSDIDWGTISLTNGSAAVTGVGTTWGLDDLRNGDTIVLIVGGENFAPPIIDTANSDTSLTLVTPWAGPSLANVQYRIRYQWDSSRISAMMRRLVDQLGNGKLQSFAALPGGANTLPYFTGLTELDQTPLTPFARTLLDDTTQAAMLATLGLFPVQSSTTDNTENRLMRTGAFGLGKPLDLRGTVMESGAPSDLFGVGYRSGLAETAAIGLSGSLYCVLEVFGHWNDGSALPAFARRALVDGAYYYQRALSSSTWGAWRRLDIQRGNNANGEWVRFPDGTQVCWRANIDVGLISQTNGTQFISSPVSVTFPATFAAPPVLTASATRTSGSGVVWATSTAGPITNTGASNMYVAGAISGSAAVLQYLATGRWF